MICSKVRRARRHDTRWPARVRSVAETDWHEAKVVNLSVSGVLLYTERPYPVGERVEVEMDFRAQPDCKTIVYGLGDVVRAEAAPLRAAIRFEVVCGPKPLT